MGVILSSEVPDSQGSEEGEGGEKEGSKAKGKNQVDIVIMAVVLSVVGTILIVLGVGIFITCCLRRMKNGEGEKEEEMRAPIRARDDEMLNRDEVKLFLE